MICYTYPQLQIQKATTGPGSIFNRQGGSIFNRREHTDDRNQLSQQFEQTLRKVIDVFGEMAFKIFDENLRVESRFNAALYDAQMLSVAQLLKKGKFPSINRLAIQKRLAKLFAQDDSFRKSISVATSDEQQLRHRVQVVRSILK